MGHTSLEKRPLGQSQASIGVAMSKPNKITRIIVEGEGGDDLTFYFDNSDEPWGIDEFVQGTRTRDGLEQIEAMIIDFNSMAERPFDPIEMRKGEQQ